MAVNFTKHQDLITTAWRKVVESTTTPNWALFGYEGSTNIINLTGTGVNGLEELVQEFNCSLIQYAFCRVIDDKLGINKLILINWQGDSAPLSRKGLCASHVGDVTNYFKGCTQTITIRNDDEATKEHLMDQILKSHTSKISIPKQQYDTFIPSAENQTHTNSNLPQTKVDISSDLAANRKSFWQRQEEEEKERLAAEKLRAEEKQAQFEKDRKQKEEFEAKKLAETIRERDRLIEANKKAEKSSESPHAAIVSSTTADDDDDGRVGRRSELLRLERNQETQSLISKGLIKSKRAIFEQAQQQQQQIQQPTLSRRSSGTMIAKRLNAFKSLDSNAMSANVDDTANNSVNKLADSFEKQVSVDGDQLPRNSTPVTIEKVHESVTLTKEEDVAQEPNSSSFLNDIVESKETDSSKDSIVEQATSTQSPPKSQSESFENGDSTADIGRDLNGNSENSLSKSPHPDQAVTNVHELAMNGKSTNIKATALFDYQAADETEISFDPADTIGYIQKVDPGWWHGQVISGRFKGQVGLFPANYVQELDSSCI